MEDWERKVVIGEGERKGMDDWVRKVVSERERIEEYLIGMGRNQKRAQILSYHHALKPGQTYFRMSSHSN